MTRLTRRSAITAGVVVLAGPGKAADAWTIVTEYPATAIPGEGIAFFASAAGRAGLAVRPQFDAPDGLRSAGMPKAVIDGTVTAGDAFAPTLVALDPIFELSALPFLTAAAADARRLSDIARPAYEAALAKRGLVVLYATPWPPTGLWSRAPITDMAAVRGLRVRTYDAASTAVFAAAGARPRQTSFADALNLLKTGELDALLSSGDGGAGARLWETLPHFTALDYAFPLSLAFCAAGALMALPAELGAAVRQAGEATQARQFAAMTTRVQENEARMRANGVQIATAPQLREVLAGRAGPVIEAWSAANGTNGAALLTRYRAGRP